MTKQQTDTNATPEQLAALMGDVASLSSDVGKSTRCYPEDLDEHLGSALLKAESIVLALKSIRKETNE